MLEIKGLTKYFGGLAAVNGLDMSVKQEEIVGLIGPNGAGKTTVFNLITGVLRLTKGKVIFDGKDITGQKPHSIAEAGITRTFQLGGFFPDFTVLQNVVAASHLYPRIGFWETLFNISSSRKKEEYIADQAMETLRLLALDRVKDEPARNLPHGYQRMLGIAIALTANPRLLLLDEPLSGMSLEEIASTAPVINKIREEGVTILLIEHNMRAAMSLCERIIVLNFGEKIAEGPPEEIRENKDVIEAYLGAGRYA